MLTPKLKIYLAIAVISMAVILLAFGLANIFRGQTTGQQEVIEVEQIELEHVRNPLNGLTLSEDGSNDFFAIGVMIDNDYTVRPQAGLSQADIIYEALAEGSITRLLAIFDSRQEVDKIGPVRSARKYYMDWAEEYGGVYMHVGGSPEALSVIDTYNFVNIDQIGAGEIYFWRDNNLFAPHNVFTSDSNWLRVGEIKEVDKIDGNLSWHFVDIDEEAEYQAPSNFSLNFSEAYLVEWMFNDRLGAYQRWQTGDKFLYNTGEQATADNIIVQIVPDVIVDDKLRRSMDNTSSGEAMVFNKLGDIIDGKWRYEDGRTRFFDSQGQEVALVPGKTWVEIVPDVEDINFLEPDPVE